MHCPAIYHACYANPIQIYLSIILNDNKKNESKEKMIVKTLYPFLFLMCPFDERKGPISLSSAVIRD